VKHFVGLVVVFLSLFAPVTGAGELSAAVAAQPLQLALPDLDGREHRLDELRGKVVLVNFWASWCLPCIEEMPSIQRLAQALRPDSFAVLGVNVSEGEHRVKGMVQRLGLGFPVLLDREGDVFRDWGATVLPTTYVLDGDGLVRYVGRGPLEWDALDVVQTLEGIGAKAAAD